MVGRMSAAGRLGIHRYPGHEKQDWTRRTYHLSADIQPIKEVNNIIVDERFAFVSKSKSWQVFVQSVTVLKINALNGTPMTVVTKINLQIYLLLLTIGHLFKEDSFGCLDIRLFS